MPPYFLKVLLTLIAVGSTTAIACPAVKGSMFNGSLKGIPAPFSPVCDARLKAVDNNEERWGTFTYVHARWREVYVVPLSQVEAAEAALRKYLQSPAYRYQAAGSIRPNTNALTTRWMSPITGKGIWITHVTDSKKRLRAYILLGTNDPIDTFSAPQVSGIIHNSGLARTGAFLDFDAAPAVKPKNKTELLHQLLPGVPASSFIHLGNDYYAFVRETNAGYLGIMGQLWHTAGNDPKKWAACRFFTDGNNNTKLSSQPRSAGRGVLELQVQDLDYGGTSRLQVFWGERLSPVGRLCSAKVL